MKFLILDSYYSPVLRHFYQNNEVKGLGYQDQKTALLGLQFGTADFYSKNLQLLGHQAEEIIINDQALQKKWAREKGAFPAKYLLDDIPYVKLHYQTHWQTEILERQILEYKPDILYCQDLSHPGTSFLTKLKSKLPVFVIGQIASPIQFDRTIFASYDLILSAVPKFVENFRKLGFRSEYFRIGFEESILSKLENRKRKYAATFIGGFSRHHNNDSGVSAATDFWGYGVKDLPPEIMSKYRGLVWGMDMYNILYNSEITLNRHIDIAGDHAGNMRLYESTGVGTMLITDYKSDLHELFNPGKELETYKTKGELLEKVKYYLDHEKEREKIAKAGQRRTLADHTYYHRMQELLIILKKYL